MGPRVLVAQGIHLRIFLRGKSFKQVFIEKPKLCMSFKSTFNGTKTLSVEFLNLLLQT